MRAFSILSAWAAICAVFIFATGSLHAQVIDGDACAEACYREKEACVEECGQHANAVECDSDCKEHLEECFDRCSM